MADEDSSSLRRESKRTHAGCEHMRQGRGVLMQDYFHCLKTQPCLVVARKQRGIMGKKKETGKKRGEEGGGSETEREAVSVH